MELLKIQKYSKKISIILLFIILILFYFIYINIEFYKKKKLPYCNHVGQMKNFIISMDCYMQDHKKKEYPVSSSHFDSRYFFHQNYQKSYGYFYKYFVDSKKKKFIYLSYPFEIYYGDRAFMVDEYRNCRMIEGLIQSDIYFLNKLKDTDLDWSKEGVERINIHLKNWKLIDTFDPSE